MSPLLTKLKMYVSDIFSKNDFFLYQSNRESKLRLTIIIKIIILNYLSSKKNYYRI